MRHTDNSVEIEIVRQRFIRIERARKAENRRLVGFWFTLGVRTAELLVRLAGKIDPRIQLSDIRVGMDDRTRQRALASILASV
jgi:hypothetical protein